jgi:hypothetical protein
VHTSFTPGFKRCGVPAIFFVSVLDLLTRFVTQRLEGFVTPGSRKVLVKNIFSNCWLDVALPTPPITHPLLCYGALLENNWDAFNMYTIFLCTFTA